MVFCVHISPFLWRGLVDLLAGSMKIFLKEDKMLDSNLMNLPEDMEKFSKIDVAQRTHREYQVRYQGEGIFVKKNFVLPVGMDSTMVILIAAGYLFMDCYWQQLAGHFYSPWSFGRGKN